MRRANSRPTRSDAPSATPRPSTRSETYGRSSCSREASRSRTSRTGTSDGHVSWPSGGSRASRKRTPSPTIGELKSEPNDSYHVLHGLHILPMLTHSERVAAWNEKQFKRRSELRRLCSSCHFYVHERCTGRRRDGECYCPCR